MRLEVHRQIPCVRFHAWHINGNLIRCVNKQDKLCVGFLLSHLLHLNFSPFFALSYYMAETLLVFFLFFLDDSYTWDFTRVPVALLRQLTSLIGQLNLNWTSFPSHQVLVYSVSCVFLKDWGADFSHDRLKMIKTSSVQPSVKVLGNRRPPVESE